MVLGRRDVAAHDVSAELLARNCLPGRHRPERLGRGEFAIGEHAVLLRGRAEIVGVDVPASEHEIAIACHAGHREMSKRQAVELVRTRLESLDSGDGRRRDRAP